jgi:hypothetical protein
MNLAIQRWVACELFGVLFGYREMFDLDQMIQVVRRFHSYELCNGLSSTFFVNSVR